MNVCVCGWYYNKAFLKELEKVNENYPVFIVGHKNVNINLPHENIPNVGLEWGAYQHYLMNVWKGGDTFFTHDDNFIDAGLFDNISKITDDVSFIYTWAEDYKRDKGGHGRAIFMSDKFLSYVKNYECDCSFAKNIKYTLLKPNGRHKGFWYDKENHGELKGYPNADNVDCNMGITHFRFCLEYRMRNFKVGFTILPVMLGYRGDYGIRGLHNCCRNLMKSAVWAD